jgi:hypothetical protein
VHAAENLNAEDGVEGVSASSNHVLVDSSGSTSAEVVDSEMETDWSSGEGYSRMRRLRGEWARVSGSAGASEPK